MHDEYIDEHNDEYNTMGRLKGVSCGSPRKPSVTAIEGDERRRRVSELSASLDPATDGG